jgi:hypothetical protein
MRLPAGRQDLGDVVKLFKKLTHYKTVASIKKLAIHWKERWGEWEMGG